MTYLYILTGVLVIMAARLIILVRKEARALAERSGPERTINQRTTHSE